MLDWDTFYFEYWLNEHEYDDVVTYQDYLDWAADKADLAMGHLNEV